ncbi:MAG: OmpH family outer membrane protein [Myxococcota bacterium]
MMRIGLVSTAVAMIVAAAPAAATAKKTSLVVVDVKKAMKSTKQWQEALKKLEDQKKDLEATLEKRRLELREEAKNLEAQKAVLAPKNYNSKLQALDGKKRQLAQELMASQQKLAYFEKGYAGQLLKRIDLVVRRLARDNDYLMIVDAGEEGSPNVLYAKKSIDITSKVIASYKKNFGKTPLTEVKLPQPGAAGAAPAGGR